MANISSYLEEAILNHVFRNTAYTSPVTVYVGLVSDTAVDADMEAGTLTNEITGYNEAARQAVTFGAPTQEEGKATIKNSAADIEFTLMPEVTVKYAIICDTDGDFGGTGPDGNILYWCPLVDGEGTPITKFVNVGDTFRIPMNELILDLD